jgi:hypothetical protein
MQSIIYPILGWSFVIVAAATPVLVTIGSIRNHSVLKYNFEAIRFRAAAAICIWLFLTLGVLLLFGFLNYVISHAMSLDSSVKPHPTISYIGLHLVYFGVCYLLVDWTFRTKNTAV